MNSSNSGIVYTEFVGVSDSFSDYTVISQGNHNRLVKAKRFGRWYMLKGLNGEYAGRAVFVELLRKEFELGISLDHPNVIRTIGKEHDPRVGDCIVLEYVDGVTLKQWLDTKPSKGERRRVILEILGAMSYFHTKGIIHRDLKPSNILITRNGGNVKVIDFGLSDSDEYAILKQPSGSVKYSAPEQSEGDVAVDLRADIYAFGAMLPEFGLAGVYKRIARKATQRNVASRYANAGQVQSAILDAGKLRAARVASLAVVLVGVGLYFWVKSVAFLGQPLPLPASVADTVVRQVVRIDTVQSIREVPVVVEKIVLKEPGESDSTYIARKKWEKEFMRKAEAKYKKLYIPLIEKYNNATTTEHLAQLSAPLSQMHGKTGDLVEELLAELDPDDEFYYQYVNMIASLSMKYDRVIGKKTSQIMQKTQQAVSPQ